VKESGSPAGATVPHRDATPVPVPLAVNEELARSTARRLIGVAEWSAPVFQSVVLLGSAIIDPYHSTQRTVVVALGAAHLLVLLPVYACGSGPFSRGGRWLAAPAVQCVTVNALIAWLAVPGTFGSSTVSLPASLYVGGFIVPLTLYPWLRPSLRRYKTPLEFTLILAYGGYLFLLTQLTSGFRFHAQSAAAVGGATVWIFVGYSFGKAGAMICMWAARAQVDIQQQSFQEFFNFLHSHVKANVAAVRAELPVEADGARQKLAELENAVSRYRVELLLAQERVPLAALFSERIRAFTGTLRIERTPRLGGMTAVRPVGVLVSRALGDLLKNAAVHGAYSVAIDFRCTPGMAVMTVTDDGPGFPASVLDDDGRSLSRLRATARDLGGDLRILPPTAGTGAVLELSVPLTGRRQQGSDHGAGTARGGPCPARGRGWPGADHRVRP
jgi:hypothetical protein